ncbi:MAG: hypothetical protein J6S85_01730 [Methanobrevibacter sp.]|nr:hypothetical protein [Methanobrevibacter sp.]MBO7712255.1 hypothetical protein [Methanobrevibacter sp.]
MSDFFMSYKDDYWKNKEEEFNQPEVKLPKTDSLTQTTQEYNQKKLEHYENFNRYGINLPDEYYNEFNKIISNKETPEEAQEEAYRIGSAIKYSQMYNIPLEEAYQKVDVFNEANFTNIKGQKGRYEAVCDMLTLGTNNVKLGELGQKLIKAHRENDTELADALMEQINAINQQNELMQDNVPRSWVMEMLKAGAQSLPFTATVATAGTIGNFIMPGAGTASAFAASSYLSAGQEYIDMLANGASPKTARIVANVSGLLQGLIEADLGLTKSIVKSTAAVMGKEAAEKTAKLTLEEIGKKVFKKFHFGAGKKVLLKYIENYGKDIFGEGLEEFLQELTSIIGQEVAAGMDGYDIPDDDIKSITSQVTEAFKGGVLGAIGLGVIPAAGFAVRDIKQFKNVKEAAETIESGEMFKAFVKDNPIFENMTDEVKGEVIQDIWEKAQQRKEEEVTKRAKDIAEAKDYGEGAEERKVIVNEEDEEEIIENEAEVRDDNGKLFYKEKEDFQDDGTIKGTLAAGDKTKENGRYGYISYTADEENKTVNIDNFKLAPGREYLRGEIFDELSRKYAGYDFEWNPAASETIKLKEKLIENNPSGNKNLNYYKDEDAIADADTRAKVAKEIRKNIHNITVGKDAEGNNVLQKSELTNKQITSAVSLLEAGAKRMGMGLSEYVDKTFGKTIFGDTEVLQKAALRQEGKNASKKAGGAFQGTAQKEWQRYGQAVKAVIYAGENADFSTWVHELAHIFQNQLEGDLLKQAESAFNVINGDWINSKYTFKDGTVMNSAEAFAYGFQDWLKTGQAENEEQKNLFKKFAEFVARAFNSLKDFINLTPEIKDVYNQLLSGDNSLLKAAEQAVEAEDRQYRAQLKKQAEEKEIAKKEAAQEEKQQVQAEKEDKSEYTDFENEENEVKSEEVSNEKVNREESNIIDNALENTNLTSEQKNEVKKVLKDENSTLVDKAKTITDAASSVYKTEKLDLFNNPAAQNLLYQLAGEPSIKRMTESEEKERILTDLVAAKQLDRKYADMDAKSKAARIRMMTGWEKDAGGQWKYELDDSINRIKNSTKIEKLLKENPDILRDTSEATLMNLGDLMEAPELFNVFPYLKNVRVSFYSDPNAYRAQLSPTGIKVNSRYLQGINGEKGLKGVLAHEIQHVIQAMEYAESQDLSGNNLNELFRNLINSENTNGFRKFDYDLESLQRGLDAYMNDEGEIEARNVARRVLMNASERRYNTLASTEDVQRQYILFQKFTDEELEQAINSFITNIKDIENNAEESLFELGRLNGMIEKGTRPSELELKIYSIKNEIIPKLAEVLKKQDWEIKIEKGLLSYDIIYFEKNGVQVSFHGNFENLNYPAANKNEWNGLYNSYLYKTAEAQKEAKYQQDKFEEENRNIYKFYNNQAKQIVSDYLKSKKIKKEVKEQIINNTHVGTRSDIFNPYNERPILEAGDVYVNMGVDYKLRKENEDLYNKVNETIRKIEFDISRIWREKKRPLMMYNSTERANIYKSRNYDNNNINTENVNILFMIAGEIGAQNLDDAEVQEGVSRMQNLAIAKQMEAVGEDAQKIRLATAWEKGSDGKWRWEIDDSKVRFDLYSAMEEWDNEHPRYRELQEKFFNTGLSEEEQEEFDKWVDERNYIQDKHTDLSFAEKIYGKDFRLPEVMNHPELFKAYPELKDVTVSIREQNSPAKGDANYEDKHINLYRAKEDTGSFEEWEKEAGSVLLHEVQHIIQGIEGFAVGGNDTDAGRYIELENQKKAEIKDKAFAWEWKIELEKQEEKHPELRGNLALMNSLIDEYTENGKYSIKELEDEHWLPTRNVRDKGFNLYVRGYDKEGFEDAYKEWQETAAKKGVNYYDAIKDTDRNRYRYYKRFAGEVESRNVQSRMRFTPEQRLNTLLAATEDVAPEDKIILFQKVYHGSGADFDKFDTENYGLSGEGSMTFGYGTYVTESEGIARSYAERMAERRPEAFLANSLLQDIEMGQSFEDAKAGAIEIYKDWAKRDVNQSYYKRIYDFALKIQNIEDLENAVKEAEKSRNLYTVEIPDDGYLEWDKVYSKKDYTRIFNEYKNYLDDNNITYRKEYAALDENRNVVVYDDIFEKLKNTDDNINGNQILGYLRSILDMPIGQKSKIVSQYLKSIGYTGIKYPAGTIHGNGNGAYNYVIFNDDDAQIINKLLFQTEAELMEDARSFDDWQEFMEFYETMGKPEITPIPYEADAQWYQSFWELAHGMQTEQEKNEQIVEEKAKNQSTSTTTKDALFVTYLESDPKMFDDFLEEVARIDSIDLEREFGKIENEEDAQERERISELKDFIRITLTDHNWATAINRIQGGHKLTQGHRRRLLSEISDGFKVRDFRALYAEVMEDEEFAVEEEDRIATQLINKIDKYKNKYKDILLPGEDINRVSPERRKRIAEEMQNRDIAAKVRNGSLKLDDEVYNYIKSLDKQIKEKQKDYDALQIEIQADYQRMADAERRRLLKLHEELLKARAKLTANNKEVIRKIEKGLKITKKYTLESQNLKANYEEIFRKFNDLKSTIQITAEVQAALDRQEQVAGLKEDINNKQKEKNLANEIKKLRIQLVKRTMRRVPFNRVDYTNARTVIAIQRILEPNLMGGVNRFIGQDSPFLRGVISGIITDKEYKDKILSYLAKHAKKSNAFVNFVARIEAMKSIKEFDSWTATERKAAIKYLPKENWIKELNLIQLAKEREESIDIDIEQKEKKTAKIDPKTGTAMLDKEGNIIYDTSFTVDYSEEIGTLVKEAVGADMFNLIVNVPFSEWTTEDLEKLAKRIDELYTEGREMFEAKKEARRKEYEELRERIENAVKDTGIVITDDDTPEEAEKKRKQIAKILGKNYDMAGTEAGKAKTFRDKLNRLIHSYSDANILRVSRILDNKSEGENVRLLYRMEDECFNAKQKSINKRTEAVTKVMKDNKITEGDLAKTIKIVGTEISIDELLYFLAADKDYELITDRNGNLINDDYAATSRNAVMFGNMLSDTESQERKAEWQKQDNDMKEALEKGTLSSEDQSLLATGQLDKTPGTTRFITACKAKWEIVISAAENFIKENPKYNALMEVIEADYAQQYERMNKISINEFNMPVHRVKAYVPLVRRESNGETNAKQVKEDLLGAYGADAGKQWVNRGMTQRRVNISPLNQKPVQTGLFKTWADSIERTEHFIAYAPYVRMLNAVYKGRDANYTRRFIESRYGRQMTKYIDDYINEVANPNAGKIREKGAEWLHILRGKTAPAYLGWKFSAIVKQGLTSPWPYMQFVNPVEYLSAATKCWTSWGKVYDTIREKSAYMKNRTMDPVNELVDEMAEKAKSKLDRGWTQFQKKGMAGLEWIDWTCVAPGWLACYQKEYNRLQNKSEAIYKKTLDELTYENNSYEPGMKEYRSKEEIEEEARKASEIDIEYEAIKYADDCTRACQPSSRSTDLAPLFKNSSEAMKAFLQFQTSLNVIWQNIRYDIPYNIKQKQFKQIVGTICGYVFAGIFMNSVMNGITGDDDDDEMQALRNLIYYSTTQFTDAIPIMGSEITNTADQLITGKRGFYGSGTDMTPSATKLLSALQKVKKGDWVKAAGLVSEGIGLYLGAPVSGTKEVYKLLGKPFKEGEINVKSGVSDVYGLAGDFIKE